MTQFGDNIYSGLTSLTSALSSRSGCLFTKTVPIGGVNQSNTVTLPVGAQNLHAMLQVLAQGSAATTNRVVVAAGAQTLITFASFGSALGQIMGTTTALGTYAPVASACANLSQTAETALTITASSVDAASSSQLLIMFSRSDNT